jgi:hypothetical protein
METTGSVNIAGQTMIVDTQNFDSAMISLKMLEEDLNPTLFYLKDKAVWKKEGTHNPIRLTNPNLQVHSLIFRDMTGSSASRIRTVRLEITMSNMDPGLEGTFMNVTRTLKTTANVMTWYGAEEYK